MIAVVQKPRLRLGILRGSSHQHQDPSLLCWRSKNKGNSNKNQKHPLPRSEPLQNSLARKQGRSSEGASFSIPHIHNLFLSIGDCFLVDGCRRGMG
jgi:hypothetical protein